MNFGDPWFASCAAKLWPIGAHESLLTLENFRKVRLRRCKALLNSQDISSLTMESPAVGQHVALSVKHRTILWLSFSSIGWAKLFRKTGSSEAWGELEGNYILWKRIMAMTSDNNVYSKGGNKLLKELLHYYYQLFEPSTPQPTSRRPMGSHWRVTADSLRTNHKDFLNRRHTSIVQSQSYIPFENMLSLLRRTVMQCHYA